MNKKADLKIEVDGQLLGGIKLRIENTFLDASLKSKLNRLQTELLQS
jgi:F0F1-type ATP synthase delta subunit